SGTPAQGPRAYGLERWLARVHSTPADLKVNQGPGPQGRTMAKGNHEAAQEEAAEHGQGQGDFPIIGLGGSAGSIDALKAFFSAVDPKSGLAFVVVQHLDPTHKSMMSELLSRASKVPVTLIKQDAEVAPNNAYVIPPNATLTIKNGRLQ